MIHENPSPNSTEDNPIATSEPLHVETKTTFTKAEQVRIQTLNDTLRTTFTAGTVVLTESLNLYPDEVRQKLLEEVQKFSKFTKDNDPYGEHDFGVVRLKNTSFYWKIDYYDKNLLNHSPDKSNPEVTERVLTIMHSSDY